MPPTQQINIRSLKYKGQGYKYADFNSLLKKQYGYGKSTSGQTIDLYATTDKSGVAMFNDVLVGTNYTLEEVETAERYIIPDSQVAVIEWEKVTENDFYNELKRGDLKVVKTSEDDMVEGVQFHLYGTSLSGHILTLQPKEEPKVERDYAADLARLRVELESYTNFENETVIPDSILEAFIERIVVYKDSFDWHLRINDNSNNTIPKEYESEFEEAVSIIDAPDTIDQSEDKLLITSFVLTIEDAKKYMYSIDTKKRVHRWKNITVNLYT